MKKRKAKDNVDDLAKASTGVPVLGHTIWWTIRDVEEPAAKMEEVLERTLGKEFMPGEPGKKRALRLALDAIESKGLVRRIRDDEVMTAYALVREVVDRSAIDIELEKRNIVIFDKRSKELEFRAEHKNSEIRELFERYSTVYTANDIRGVVLEFVRARHGITLRETGGIYFLPHSQDVELLRKFVEEMGGEFYSLPIVDSGKARGQMMNLVRLELLRDIEVAAEDVKRLAAKEGTQAGTYRNRLEDFQKLEAKMNAYVDLLKIDASEMETRLRGLRDEVSRALQGTLEAYPQAAQFPHGSRVRYIGKRSAEAFGEEGTGTVIGYANLAFGPYVKVLADSTGQVRNCSVKVLELV